MDSHDLEVDNYDLEDLLELFKLDYNFSEEDLKGAKKICLQTHPDKSGLEPKYFIFYKKAFEVIAQLFYFRGKRKNRSTEYHVECNESDKKILENVQKNENFNEWFNKNFEKIKIKDEEHDCGYDTWYHSKEPEKQMNDEEFYRIKRESCAIARNNVVKDIGSKSGFNLVRENIEYSSDIFSKLKYQDLKKAHTETLIPVTKEVFDSRPKFANVESYRMYRNTNKPRPRTMEESQRILLKQDDIDGTNNTKRAFKMYKQDLEIEKANNIWWKNIKQLEYC